MDKNSILEKYSNVIIGDNYKDEKLYCDIMDNKDKLISTLYDFLGRDIDLNKEGIEFLRDFWGIEQVAKIVFEHESGEGDFVNTFKSEEGLTRWLKDML